MNLDFPRLRLLSSSMYYLVMIVLAIPFLFPTLWMLTASLKSDQEIFQNPLALIPQSISWDNFTRIFHDYPFAAQYVNSVYIAVVVTALTLIIGALAGYGFARLNFPGKDLMFILCLSAMMLPSEALSIPQFALFKFLGINNTHLPIILLQIFGGTGALAVFMMRQHFLTLPRELDEAALMDGLDRWGIFWRIMLPLARPVLVAVGIFAFLNSWNDYFNPLVYLNSSEQYTLPLGLQTFTDPLGGVFWNLTLAASTLSTLPLLLAFLVAQKQFVQSMVGSSVKG
ncbi:carbohydrate ABC transporter permease [Deinococcus cellulosilyticus]|uniref:sn-glycerol-3-phosphate transport system permease protein UgpE n=1 Tax=Deinococcus cellulosilyticus (strain DSM 18568 / NBRC 106333 / KACC 11606 / 5516J-15) TaxID=1223518 RepID=A0A511MY68_DEIC1|nr:carbohydrate ABC transporter permease [Deinococcus cellulosilyticus]GEM45503.1 sn-glycerol-3-phosphate transport system permease protein UgpE [Deinococcus cellulosilyticus NBRC 106333 = KACC 11606]